MGKARITANLGDYQYTIRLEREEARLDNDKSTLMARLAAIDSELISVATRIAAAQTAVDNALADMDLIIAEINTGTKKLSDVIPYQTAIISARQALIQLQNNEKSLKLEKIAIQKRLVLIAAALISEDVSAWCADATEDLTGNVGTIEPIGEPADYIIRPGFEGAAAYDAARDGQMQKAIAGTPAGTFYNWALRPLWQKWKPTYRIGTISALDTATDTCNVLLDEAISADRPYGTEININQAETFNDVPIEYMDCNSQAFENGDRVVVEFTAQDFSDPRVIGFESNPRPCAGIAVFTVVFASLGKSVAVAWNMLTNALEFEPVDVEDTTYQEWLSSHSLKGEAMFGSAAACGRSSIVGSLPALCPDITSGLTDIGSASSSQTLLGYCGGDNLWHNEKSWSYIINACTPSLYTDIALESAVWPVLLPSAPQSKVGFRTYEGINGNLDQTDTCAGGVFWSDGTLTETIEDMFYGPLGHFGTFNGTRNGTGDAGHFYHFVPETEIIYFIPKWLPQDNAAWTPEKRWAYNRTWYGSSYDGKYNNLFIADVTMVHYTPCTKTREFDEFDNYTESWVFNAERIIHVQAQAFKATGGTTGFDWITQGRNTELETKIKLAIELGYSLNAIPTNEIRDCQVGVELY